jgi:hypothetical protein
MSGTRLTPAKREQQRAVVKKGWLLPGFDTPEAARATLRAAYHEGVREIAHARTIRVMPPHARVMVTLAELAQQALILEAARANPEARRPGRQPTTSRRGGWKGSRKTKSYLRDRRRLAHVKRTTAQRTSTGNYKASIQLVTRYKL